MYAFKKPCSLFDVPFSFSAFSQSSRIFGPKSDEQVHKLYEQALQVYILLGKAYLGPVLELVHPVSLKGSKSAY